MKEFFWVLNYNCNYNCPICLDLKKIKLNPEFSRLDCDILASKLSKLGQNWSVTLSGGEPFIHPQIDELLDELYKKKISVKIQTNLSLIFSLQKFPYTNIYEIEASVHAQMKTEKQISEFIERVLLLREIGYYVKPTYILLPNNKEITLKHIKEFKENNIELWVRPFKDTRGKYNGGIYPRDYSDEDKEILQIDGINIDYFKSKSWEFYTGERCSSGRNLIFTKPNGDMYNCNKKLYLLGNLFNDDEIRPLKNDVICTSKNPCICGFGYKFSKEKKCQTD